MNLKYYLRGLGVGIIVTAVIMEVALGGKKEPYSDAEVIARAKELGMVEETGLLSDMEKEEPVATPEPSETPEPEATPEPSAMPEDEVTAEAEAIPKSEATSEIETTPEPSAVPETAAEEDAIEADNEAVSVVIKSGEGSYTICRQLEEAGLITSAEEFDRFLYQNGYDKKLRIGSYEIPKGTSEEEIAKILVAG